MGVIGGLFHVTISPDKATAIAGAGVAVAGLAAALLPEKK